MLLFSKVGSGAAQRMNRYSGRAILVFGKSLKLWSSASNRQFIPEPADRFPLSLSGAVSFVAQRKSRKRRLEFDINSFLAGDRALPFCLFFAENAGEFCFASSAHSAVRQPANASERDSRSRVRCETDDEWSECFPDTVAQPHNEVFLRFFSNWTNGEIAANDGKYLRLAFGDGDGDVAFVELSAERVSTR